MKNVIDYLTERASVSKKADYEEGTFGYWWTKVKGEKDIQGQHYKGLIGCHEQNLTSLEGAPSSISGNFSCSYNKLESLEGAPSSISGNFYCFGNNLESLEGAPSSVGGDIDCSYNKLKSLEGAPSSVGGHFDCTNNSIKFTKEEVLAVSKIKGKIYV
jgi:hypothetical protein